MQWKKCECQQLNVVYHSSGYVEYIIRNTLNSFYGIDRSASTSHRFYTGTQRIIYISTLFIHFAFCFSFVTFLFTYTAVCARFVVQHSRFAFHFFVQIRTFFSYSISHVESALGCRRRTAEDINSLNYFSFFFVPRRLHLNTAKERTATTVAVSALPAARHTNALFMVKKCKFNFRLCSYSISLRPFVLIAANLPLVVNYYYCRCFFFSICCARLQRLTICFRFVPCDDDDRRRRTCNFCITIRDTQRLSFRLDADKSSNTVMSNGDSLRNVSTN